MQHYKNLSPNDIEGEIWKPITIENGIFSERYMVSNFGRIKSILNTNQDTRLIPKIIRQQVSKAGKYLSVSLWNNNFSKRRKVHVLMAIEFLSNPLNKPFVNHKDGVKFNNSLDNFEWVTQLENNIHAYENGLKTRGQDFVNSKLDNEKVMFIIKSDLSYTKLGDMFGVSFTTISGVRNGYTWSHVTGLPNKRKSTAKTM